MYFLTAFSDMRVYASVLNYNLKYKQGYRQFHSMLVASVGDETHTHHENIMLLCMT